MRALADKGYDVNYAWGMNTHGQRMGGPILPEMMRWLWRDHPVSTDVNDATERSFNEPKKKTDDRSQNSPAVFSPTAGDYATADIRVLTPGVVFASGLPDIAAAFTKETGKKVGITVVGMGTIVDEMKKKTPPPDVIVLPFQLMTSLALEGGVAPGTFTPLGRNRMGLAVRAGAPKPDISTIEKLAVALKSAKAVMRSNPATRTMVAQLIDDVLKRPEFAGVNTPASTNGEGGQALARGEGDMAIQTISQILPYKEIELVGPLPAELGAWIDTAAAVSARATHADDARALIRYVLRPESTTVWKPRGLERFE
jgi:molybdate transport system substrate-binding protein